MSHEHRLPLSPTSGITSVRVRQGDAWVPAEIDEVGPAGLKIALRGAVCPQGRELTLVLAIEGFEDQLLKLSTEVVTLRRPAAGRTLVSLRYGNISCRGERAVIVTFLTRVAGRVELDDRAFSRTGDGWSYPLDDLLAGGTRPIVNRREPPGYFVPAHANRDTSIESQTRRRARHAGPTVHLLRAAAWATEHRDGQATVCASSADGLQLRIETEVPLPSALETIWLSICPRQASETRMRVRGTVLQTFPGASAFTVRLVPVGLAGHLDRWQTDVQGLAAKRVQHDMTVLEMATQPIEP